MWLEVDSSAEEEAIEHLQLTESIDEKHISFLVTWKAVNINR